MNGLVEISADEHVVRTISSRVPYFTTVEELPRLEEPVYQTLGHRVRGQSATLYNVVATGPFWVTHTPLEVFRPLIVPVAVFQNRRVPSFVAVLVFHSPQREHESVTRCCERYNTCEPRLTVNHIEEIAHLDDLLKAQMDTALTKISVLNESDLLLYVREFMIRSHVSQLDERVLGIMDRYDVSTLEGLTTWEPDIVSSLLHLPHLNAIVQNCAAYHLGRKLHHRDSIYERLHSLNETYPRGNPCQIVQYLVFQKVPLHAFVRAMVDLLGGSKKNMLLLHGPPSTGKSAFLRPLFRLFDCGEIMDSCGFEACYGKQLMVYDNLELMPENVGSLKRLAEGLPLILRHGPNDLRTLKAVPIMAMAERIPAALDAAFSARIHFVKFTKPSKNYAQFTYCERPSVSCPRRPSLDRIRTETYWTQYAMNHESCAATCGHCSLALCHVEATTEGDRLHCFDHHRTHLPVDAPRSEKKSAPRQVTYRPNTKAPLKIVIPNVPRHEAITPNDWVAFFLTYVSAFKETHD